MTLSLGIDLGTSGIRCAVIDASGSAIAMTRGNYPDASANGWWEAVKQGLHALREQIGDSQMQAIQGAAIDGTSGTMVLVDAHLAPVTDPLMYNSTGFDAEAAHIAIHAPEGDITRGSSSALARLLRLQKMDAQGAARHLCHQADFVLAKLTGRGGFSDENNSLKTGYDVAKRRWPVWFDATDVNMQLFPEVHPVGTPIAQISPTVAAELGFSKTLKFHAGTTDSIAAFLATGAAQIGDVVTSLGTTLAIKMLSDVRIDDPSRGVYSHRLGDRWLVGGASNTGGGALLTHFNVDQLASLSSEIDTRKPSGLDYYPLPKVGERLPVNNPHRSPVVTPRPESDVQFLHGLLEGITRIEAKCYAALQDLGAPEITQIFTAGGGANNPAWLSIRRTLIQYPFRDVGATEAAVGVAKLGQQTNSHNH